MATILTSAPWAYELTQTDEGRLILTVVCGTVGVYELSLQLDPEEVGGWNREGESYIADLAAAITAEPSRYWHRHVG